MSFLFGSKALPEPPNKRLGLNDASGATNAQGEPLTYWAGKRRFSGTFISDAFDQRTVSVGSGGKNSGKGGGSSNQYNYYAGFGVAFGLGPADGFHDLFLNGDAVYTESTPLHAVKLSQVSNVATFQTSNSLGLANGVQFTAVITGAAQTEFNGEFLCQVVSDTQFQYAIPGSSLPAETATGQIQCWIKLDPIFRAADDSVAITVPNYGVLTFYWGTETQPADGYLAVSGVRHSPMHGVCYGVFHQWFLGLNQTNIQNVEVVLSRCPAPAWLQSSTHANIQNESNPAVVIYELLTHPRAGCGLTDADFNLTAFGNAALQFFEEGMGVSPLANRVDEAASVVTEICEAVDAVLTLDANGLLTLLPVRAPAIYSPAGGVVVLTDDQLANLPKPKAADWSSAATATRIVFPNQDASFLNDFVEWKDFAANTAALAAAQEQNLQRDCITRRDLALVLVQAAGSASALPLLSGSVDLLFTTALWTSLAPGTVIQNNFSNATAARANGFFRVTKRTWSDPAKPVFTVEYSSDRSYLNLNPANLIGVQSGGGGAPVGDEVPPTVQPLGVNSSLFELPVALCPNGRPAIAPLVQRDQVSTTAAQLWLGRSYAFNGAAPDSFFSLATITKFALHGGLTADFLASAPLTSVGNALPGEAANYQSPFPLTAGLAVQLDGPDLVLPDASDFDALANSVLVFVGEEIMSLAQADLTGAGAYTLTVIRGCFGTAIADHHAQDEVFVLPLADLLPVQHPHILAANTAVFKLTLGTQQVADVSQFDITFTGNNWKFPVYLQQPPP